MESESPLHFPAAIAALEREVAALKEMLLAKRRVDLVGFGPLRVFMYCDDLAYQQLPPHFRFAKPEVTKSARLARTAEQVYADPSSPLPEILFAHHWLQGIEPSYIDIGCQYGSHTIEMARFFEASGHDTQVIAFEPGAAGELVEYNLQLNGVSGRIRLVRAAVTAGTYPVLLFAEAGHSENNRVVNGMDSPDQLSWVVQGVSIADYVETQRVPRPLILKVDTQGGEFEVLLGMRGLLGESTMILEFTPHALQSRVDPAAWMRGLAATHRLFDLAMHEFTLGPVRGLLEVGADAAEVFAADVDSRPGRYTDLLAIPHVTIALDALLRKFECATWQPPTI